MRHYVTLPDGRQVHVRVSGSGPVVLLLRDWPHSGAVTAEPMPSHLPGCTVIAPDSPGYGQSPYLRVTDLGEHAEVLVSLLEVLGVERCVVRASGLGSALAVALARRAHHRVAGLVLDRLPTTADLRALDPDRLAPSSSPPTPVPTSSRPGTGCATATSSSPGSRRRPAGGWQARFRTLSPCTGGWWMW